MVCDVVVVAAAALFDFLRLPPCDIVGNFSTLKATSPLFIYRAVKESLPAIRKVLDV